ncbi:MAG: Rrf2 family transcriptional regulator [bacterium]|nr:Rrf2 family transcriptional regulator [bacterium]
MIRFSRSEDYAIILIHSLAKVYKKRLIPLPEIAKDHHISLLFLRNLASILRKADIIGAVEGKHGGYFLKSDPRHLKIGDILHVFSPNPFLPCCEIGSKKGSCDKAKFCSTGVVWRKLNQEFLQKVSAMTLQEFIGQERI